MATHRRHRRVALATTAAGAIVIVSMVLGAGGVSAATVAYTWQARMGGGAADLAILYVYEAGNATLRIRASDTGLPARSSFAATIRKGGCPSTSLLLGTTLVTLPRVSSGAGGAVQKTLAVSAASAKKVRAAWNAGNRLVLVLVGRSKFWCSHFAAVGRRGGSVRVGSQQVHVVTRAEHWATPPGVSIEGDGIYATVYVRITAREQTEYSDLSYGLLAPDGTTWSRPIGALGSRSPDLGSGDLAPGESAEGWVTNAVPPDDHDSLTLVYEGGFDVSAWSWEEPTVYVPLGKLADETSVASPSPSPMPTT
jgi:hypothetical protein